MASDEQLEAMRAYETIVWPRVEHGERHYRRTDRLFVAAYVLGILMISMGAATLPRGPLSGAAVGLGIALGFAGGIVHTNVSMRRAAFKRMRELHEQAELTLLYHREDEP